MFWCTDCERCAEQPCDSCPAFGYLGVEHLLVALLPVALVPVALLLSHFLRALGVPRGDHITWPRCALFVLLVGGMVLQVAACVFFLLAAPATARFAPDTTEEPLHDGNLTRGIANVSAPAPQLVADLRAPCDPRFHGVGALLSGAMFGRPTWSYLGPCTGDRDTGASVRILRVVGVLQPGAALCTYGALVLLHAFASVTWGLMFTVASAVAQIVVFGLVQHVLVAPDFCRTGRSLAQLGFRRYVGLEVQPYALVGLMAAASLMFHRLVQRAADPTAPDDEVEFTGRRRSVSLVG